jgi:hypothetical protein
VPVGIEKVLFRAARDPGFRGLLLEDRPRALQAAGVELRPFEREMLAAISPAALAGTIDSLVPENPRKRRFMGLVAAATTSLAAGTAVVSCDDPGRDDVIRGDTTDTDSDSETDTDTDSDTGTVDTDTGPPETDGMTIGDEIDGDFADWPGWNARRGGGNG